MYVCVCSPFLFLFASGLGMKGPGALVSEALADVSWPVGAQLSRIRLLSQASFWLCSDVLSLLSLCPIPLPSFRTQVSFVHVLNAWIWICVFLHHLSTNSSLI